MRLGAPDARLMLECRDLPWPYLLRESRPDYIYGLVEPFVFSGGVVQGLAALASLKVENCNGTVCSYSCSKNAVAYIALSGVRILSMAVCGSCHGESSHGGGKVDPQVEAGSEAFQWLLATGNPYEYARPDRMAYIRPRLGASSAPETGDSCKSRR